MATTTPKAVAAKTEEVFEDAADAGRKALADAPAPVRELAEKTVQQAKEGYGKWKAAAEEASDALEDAYASASKGYKELSRKSIEATRSNINAHFDFLNALISAKSVSQAVDLQTSYARQQIEVLTGQAKELSALAQKAATEGTKPFKDLTAKTLRLPQAN